MPSLSDHVEQHVACWKCNGRGYIHIARTSLLWKRTMKVSIVIYVVEKEDISTHETEMTGSLANNEGRES